MSRITAKRVVLAACAAGLGLVVGGWSSAWAITYYVDQNNASASDGNAGTSPALPLLTINRGISLAVAGDTISVNAGRYHEAVYFGAHSGTAGQPITLKAAAGQRVLVDSGAVLSGWTPCDSSYASRNGNYANIYHVDLTTDGGPPFALYQDDGPLAEAGWPAIGMTGALGWWSTATITSSSPGSTLTDPVHLTQADGYWTGGRVLYFGFASNAGNNTTITSYTQSTHSLTIAGQWYGTAAPGDGYRIYDKLETITGPGQWAFDRLGGNSYRLYVWPAGGGTPSSHLLEAGTDNNGTGFGIEVRNQTYITIDGLEVSYTSGIGIGGYGPGDTPAYLTVQNCCIHDNENIGVCFWGQANVTIYHNYIGYNGAGVIAPNSYANIQENEIGRNGSQNGSCDGIDLVGDDPGPNYSSVINHNYIHDNNYFYSHCDSIQSYDDVYGALIENNLCLNSGQSYMMSSMSSTTLSNNIFAQSQAYMICDYIDNTTFQHDTMANAGYGNAVNDGLGFSIHNCLFYLGHGGYNDFATYGTSYVADYNFYYPADGFSEADSPVLWTNSAGAVEWNWTWAQYKSASGQDGNSIYAGNPQFINAPAFFQLCDGTHAAFFTPSLIFLVGNNLSSYAVGDHIEIDHDGVVRTVSAMGTDTTTVSGATLYYLTFSPSSAATAEYAGVVANWKANTNYNVNYNLQSTSPAKGKASDGGNMGASINMAQMVAGDFNGDGVRDIPSWPYTPPATLTVQVTPAGGGTVTVTPSQGLYSNGDTVQILATPATAPFSGWTAVGGTVLNPTASLTTLTISGNCTLTAYFAGIAIPVPVTTHVSPAGGGSVTVTPSQATYTQYSTVAIQAAANTGYYFVSWSVTGGFVANTSAASTSLTLTSSGTLVANFLPPLPVTTQVSPAGDGTVTVTPSQAAYPPNTVVAIQAASSSGYAFSHWTVNGGSVSNALTATTSLTITGSCTLTGNFVPGYSGTENETGGTITLSSSGPYTYGQVVTATESTQPGYVFSGWSVTGPSTLSSSSAVTTSLTVYGNFTLTASVTPLQYTLTANAAPAGYGTVACTPSQAQYTYGTVVQIQATPGANYALVGWTASGGTVSNVAAASTSLTINGNCTLTARFVAFGTPVPLDISSAFNMEAWFSPAMWQFCKVNGSDWVTLNGGGALEAKSFADGLGQGYVLVGDTSLTESGALYGPGVDPPGNDSYSVVTDYNYPHCFSLGQGTPEHGVLTSTWDARPYDVASIAGNATLPGNWLDRKNAVVVGQNYGVSWSVTAVTINLTPSYYSDLNLVLAAGHCGYGGGGACDIQIWAIYADSSSQLLYNFGPGTRDVEGENWAGPDILGGTAPSYAPVDPDFAVVYTAAYDYSAAPDTYGAVGDLGAPMHLYEFAYPLSLNHTVALSKLKVVYTGPSEYVNSELAIFAATATPYTPPTPYTVTVNQTTGGTVSVSPTQAVYYSSNTATVTAAAATSYAFVGWNVAGGLISPSASQATLTVLGNVTLSASFAPLSYTGTEQASGGAITVSSPGPYYYGTQISVTASANPGYLFTGWTSSGCSLSNSAVTSTTLTVLGNWTLTAHFTSETFTVALATSTTRVYQNTPVTTKDRHVVALTVSATDTWGNTTYTATLTQTGPGMVTPTQTWTSGTLVPPTGNAPVVWTSPATPTGLSGWLVGGRVSGTVTGAANLGVLTGSCTVTVTVIGNQSGLSNPAAATVMITVRPLGDINNNGQVDNMDLAILNARLNAFAIAPQTDTDCDLSGDGSVTAADRVRLNLILNGLPVP